MSSKNISRRFFLFGRKVVDDDSGTVVIEYGILASLISVGIMASLQKTGKTLKNDMRCTSRVVKGRRIGRRCRKAGF